MDSNSMGYFDPDKLLLYEFFLFSIYMVGADFDTINTDYNSISKVNNRKKNINQASYRKTCDIFPSLSFDILPT